MTDIPHLIQRMKYWSGPSEHWPKAAREACADAASALASIPDMVAKLQALDSACAQYGCQFEKIAEKNAKLGAAAEEGKELRDINDRLRSRIQERNAEMERLRAPVPNPPLTMNDALALLGAQAREIERLKRSLETAKAVCAVRNEDLAGKRRRIVEQNAEIERLKDDFQRIQSVYDFAKQAAKLDGLRSRNAELEAILQAVAPYSLQVPTGCGCTVHIAPEMVE